MGYFWDNVFPVICVCIALLCLMMLLQPKANAKPIEDVHKDMVEKYCSQSMNDHLAVMNQNVDHLFDTVKNEWETSPHSVIYTGVLLNQKGIISQTNALIALLCDIHRSVSGGKYKAVRYE